MNNLTEFMILGFFILICACKEEKVDHGIPLNTISFDLEKDLYDSKDISGLVDSIQVIKLETNEDYLISEISKILYDKEYIYILDDDMSSGVLFKYTRSGKFVQKISNKGKGPGEYISLSDFILRNDQVVLLDAGIGKMMFFSKSGKFVKEFSVDETFAEKFGKIGSDYFAVFNENYLDYNIHIIDDNGNTIKKLMKVPSYLKNRALNLSTKKATTYFEGRLLYIDPYRNDIFQVDKDSITIKYRFNFGKHSFDLSSFLNVNRQYGTSKSAGHLFADVNKEDVVNKLDNFSETSKYLFFECLKKGKIHQFYHNKVKNKSYVSSGSGILPHIYSDANQNTFVSVLESYVVEDMKKLDLTKLSKDKLFSKIIPLVEQTSDSDNPILITYYFK